MLLKRKRSAPDFCSSPPSCSSASSPPPPSTAARNATMDMSARVPHDALASHLPRRTLKRFRDSRPSDEEVHERTLNLLYSAQQQNHQAPLPAPFPVQATAPAPSLAGGGSQHSLHRFWSIRSAPSSAPGADLPVAVVPSSCEDCGAGLGGASDDMDLDVSASASASALDDTACGACGKHVCFGCSVSNLGKDKRCLQCAGPRVWVGGIGWTNAGVSVC